MPEAGRKDWGTPAPMWAMLKETFGDFDLDPCTSPDNRLGTPKFYTVADNGLAQPWVGKVYANPPYGTGISNWIFKAVRSVLEDANTLVVMLVPARVDTQWWAYALLNHAEVCFIEGRVKFAGAPAAAPFPSALLVFRRRLPTRMSVPR
jgi:phage N-6-adenine-methyltransferase